MNNPNEIQGVRDLLDSLEDEILISLGCTITQHLKIDISNREDAKEAIILHSQNAETVLRRKAMSRDVLSQYLHNKHISVPAPITKSWLIDRVLTYWTRIGEQTYSSNTTPTTSNERSGNESINQLQDSRLQPNLSQEVSNIRTDTINFPINIMARSFSEWFYQLLNDPTSSLVEHFWPDCFLILKMQSGGDTVEHEATGAEGSVNLLRDTRCAHNLYYNPNLCHEGVQGRMDPHGLVLIVACGTLHSNNLCVGTFEQVFGLARDPFSENNWKIKNSKVYLRSSNVFQLPRLCDSGLTSNILAMPETDGAL